MSKRRNKWKARYKRLQAVVTTIYVSAAWESDRYVENERELWAELRDAAGIETGTKTGILKDAIPKFTGIDLEPAHRNAIKLGGSSP